MKFHNYHTIKGKTYVVPKEDFQLEKYLLLSNVMYVVKTYKTKKTSKSKVFIVKKDQLKEAISTNVSLDTSMPEGDQIKFN